MSLLFRWITSKNNGYSDEICECSIAVSFGFNDELPIMQLLLRIDSSIRVVAMRTAHSNVAVMAA